MTEHDIRLHRLAGQHLLAPADTSAIARDLCGIQAQYLSHAQHALAIRGGADPSCLVKTWAQRGTMHLIHPSDLPLFLHEGRKRFLRPVDTFDDDQYISAQRKRIFADIICRTIADGRCEREELRLACRRSGMTADEESSLFDPWGGIFRALCEAGRICLLPAEQKRYALCAPFTPMAQQAAQKELARRYFTHYGPATAKDAAYFFGVPQKEIRTWMDTLPLTSVQISGTTYYHIAGASMPAGDMPRVLFLAGFDQLMLGYDKSASLFLPEGTAQHIFTRAGSVRPAVLMDGQVIGSWKRERSRVAITLLRPAPHGLLEDTALQLPGVKAVVFA